VGGGGGGGWGGVGGGWGGGGGGGGGATSGLQFSTTNLNPKKKIGGEKKGSPWKENRGRISVKEREEGGAKPYS